MMTCRVSVARRARRKLLCFCGLHARDVYVDDFVNTGVGGSYVHACPMPSSSSSVADTEWPRAILRRSIHRVATHPPPAASRSNAKSTALARAPKPASEWSPISTCASASRNGTSRCSEGAMNQGGGEGGGEGGKDEWCPCRFRDGGSGEGEGDGGVA